MDEICNCAKGLSTAAEALFLRCRLPIDGSDDIPIGDDVPWLNYSAACGLPARAASVAISNSAVMPGSDKA